MEGCKGAGQGGVIEKVDSEKVEGLRRARREKSDEGA